MDHKIQRVQSDLPQGMNFYLERREVKAGELFSPHWHDYFEFELVLSGHGEQIYNHNRMTLERGSAYLMSYYDFHGLRAISDMVLLKIQFNEQVLPQELNQYIVLNRNRFCCHLGETDTARIAELWERIDGESRARELFYEYVIRNDIMSVIVTLLRQVPMRAQPLMPNLLQTAVAYVHNHFRENLSLTQVARECSVTPNYLGMRFSQWMDVSFSDYLNTLRLRYACDLLTGTDLSVKEIAFSSGYHSVEHFDYIFRRKLSCTPMEFRRGTRQR